MTIAKNIKQAVRRNRFLLSDKQLEQLKTVGNVILTCATVSGGIAVAVMAPNAFQALKLFDSKKNRKYSSDKAQKKIAKSLYYLKRKGLIETAVDQFNVFVHLTKRGREKIDKLNFENLTVNIQGKQWDGHWWLVLADVPSKEYRHNADRLREKLKSMNFYPLQRSVWVFPYSSRKEVAIVSEFFDIARFVTTMEVTNLESFDQRLLTNFFKNKGII